MKRKYVTATNGCNYLEHVTQQMATLTQMEDYIPKFEKGMTNMESTDLPNTRHMMRGGCRVQKRLLP